jgi:hypothetical protein
MKEKCFQVMQSLYEALPQLKYGGVCSCCKPYYNVGIATCDMMVFVWLQNSQLPIYTNVVVLSYRNLGNCYHR